ncbi:MAG: hypothetical protein H0V17_30195 [Deltaproteobacteria bacterium]|nr:hypothetical protein [Deltaproteobacteria bacterium]
MSADKTLAEILAHRMMTGEPIPVPLTLAIVRQVCEALDWAHNLRDPEGRPLGIVHRDVSPAYIVVAETGVVRLVGSTAPHPKTAYMSPELITTGMVDPRSDLFALGVVAHEMLSNHPLFATGDDRSNMERVCNLAIPAPSAHNPAVAPDIDGIVFMALAREPAYRWQYAAMMRDGVASVFERLGFQIGPDDWADLLSNRPPRPAPEPVLPNVQFSSPEPQPPLREPPPSDPDLWASDTNVETVIRPTDPALDEVDAFMASVSPATPPSHPVAPAEVRVQIETPDAASEPAFDRAATATPPLEDPEPDMALRPTALQSTPTPSETPPTGFRRPRTAFELEIPEATQIGAIPLVSFDPSANQAGAPPPRPKPAPTLPPPMVTFLPDPDDDKPDRKKLLIIVGLVAVVSIGATLGIVLLAS